MAELLEARQGAPIERTVLPYSMDDLAARLYRSPKWLGMQSSSQYTYRRIIDRYLERTDRNGRRFGTYPVKKATIAGVERHVAELAATPASANNLLKALKRMFAYAVKLEWITSNPAEHADGFKAGPGWHTWTDQEIDRFRAYWPYGTMARLTFELALNTAARRCNLAELERDNLVNGRWEIAHAKKGDETSVQITPEARAAIEALPAAPIRFFITSAAGTPYTAESLGNRFRKWAKEADCPTQLHGIRKGVSRILAESGATDAEGQSITGQKKSKTFAHYRAKADRKRLADNAMAKLIGEPDLANPEKS
jgi:site-specific recombinase XerD